MGTLPAADIFALLKQVYGAEIAKTYEVRIAELIATRPIPPRTYDSSEQDIILITYGDQLTAPGRMPLATLHKFVQTYCKPINTVHLLPHYPYTSDDGFSVSDYLRVNPALGTWDDIRALQQDCHVMLDAVFNHMSVSHAWFQGYLASDPRYKDYCIDLPADTDVSRVTRPRTHPLLTPFETAMGTKYVWTTFSADQVDNNFGNPEVVMELLGILLEYIRHGADLIRLDAIGFIWKDPATSSIHHPHTHALVKLMRAVLHQAAPWVWLVTETNVPHHENISYFGTGSDEAHMVYNFTLPPLTLHALQTGSARKLREWVATLQTPSDATTFFNFTASHDGIGIRGVTGILDGAAITALCDRVVAAGGKLSMKTNPDGSQSVYELNISYFNAVAGPDADAPLAVDAFICSQAIALSLAGIPGVYMHSLLGSTNWADGVAQTGANRSINREKLDLAAVERELADPSSRRARVYGRYMELLAIRTAEPAFAPHAPQTVLRYDDAVFAVLRGKPTDPRRILALHNTAAQSVAVPLDGAWNDLVSGTSYGPTILLAPYQVAWLQPAGT